MKKFMNAVITNGFGEPSVLQISKIALPVNEKYFITKIKEIKNDEVLIKIQATALNRADTLQVAFF